MIARRSFVLDSWAMMAFFENHSSAKRVEELLLQAHRSGAPLSMSVVNAGELWYSTARAHSAPKAERVIEELTNLRIDIVPADWETTRQASIFKARARIAYADCFAAALAKLKEANLVTGDREFRQVEKDIEILWI